MMATVRAIQSQLHLVAQRTQDQALLVHQLPPLVHQLPRQVRENNNAVERNRNAY